MSETPKSETPEKKSKKKPEKKPSEEIANCLTHGGGLLLAVVGAVILVTTVTKDASVAFRIGCWVYALALIALYGASTLSHLFKNPERRHFFRTLDQGVIFLFIASTFTPLALAYIDGPMRWVLIAGTWGAALFGFCSKMFWRHRIESTAIMHYLAMGWLPVLACIPILQKMPAEGLFWFVAGGVCYTVGTIFLTLDSRVPYFHAVWHVLVIAGSFCHFLVIVAWAAPLEM